MSYTYQHFIAVQGDQQIQNSLEGCTWRMIRYSKDLNGSTYKATEIIQYALKCCNLLLSNAFSMISVALLFSPENHTELYIIVNQMSGKQFVHPPPSSASYTYTHIYPQNNCRFLAECFDANISNKLLTIRCTFNKKRRLQLFNAYHRISVV